MIKTKAFLKKHEITCIPILSIIYLASIYSVYNSNKFLTTDIYAGFSIGGLFFCFIFVSKIIKRTKFKILFGFRPKFLMFETYQTQALAKLLFCSKYVLNCQLRIKSPLRGIPLYLEEILPDSEDIKIAKERKKYEETLRLYMTHLELIEYYQPEFARTIPHWAHLNNFIKTKFTNTQKVSENDQVSEFLLN